VASFIHFFVNLEGAGSAWVLRYDDLCGSLIKVRYDLVAVKSLVGQQRTKFEPINERFNADRIEPLPCQKHEANEITQRIRQREGVSLKAVVSTVNGLSAF
jgi:hypothetical protein